jgi:hypothetical protein
MRCAAFSMSILTLASCRLDPSDPPVGRMVEAGLYSDVERSWSSESRAQVRPPSLSADSLPAKPPPTVEQRRDAGALFGFSIFAGGSISVFIGVGFGAARNLMGLNMEITEGELQRLDANGPPDAYVSTFYELEAQRSAYDRRQKASTIALISGGCAIALGLTLALSLAHGPRSVAIGPSGLAFRF